MYLLLSFLIVSSCQCILRFSLSYCLFGTYTSKLARTNSIIHFLDSERKYSPKWAWKVPEMQLLRWNTCSPIKKWIWENSITPSVEVKCHFIYCCHHKNSHVDPWSTLSHGASVTHDLVCSAEAAVVRLRHLWGCPHPGNARRFITYWYAPSLNTPPKTPTVHCWLMSCTASSPWIIFLKRIFPPFPHSLFLWFHILCQIDKVLPVQPNKETVFFPAIMRFSRWERKRMKWWWMFFYLYL